MAAGLSTWGFHAFRWRRGTRRRGVLIALAALAAGGLAWAALAPIAPASHDELFEIPHGTWARRMAGDKVEILPTTYCC